MSVTAFLRWHGWKARGDGWEHPRLPDIIHDADAALLQQAQWLAHAVDDAMAALVLLQEAFVKLKEPT